MCPLCQIFTSSEDGNYIGALIVQLRLLPDSEDYNARRHAIIDRQGIARFEDGEEVNMFKSLFLCFFVSLFSFKRIWSYCKSIWFHYFHLFPFLFLSLFPFPLSPFPFLISFISGYRLPRKVGQDLCPEPNRSIPDFLDRIRL